MRRREVFRAIGGTAVFLPVAARAQQPAVPMVGFLSSRSLDNSSNTVAGFKAGLKETGFVEGENLAVEYCWASGEYDRLPALAAQLVRHNASVIFTTGSTLPAVAAKSATTTIPIVFTGGEDPVRAGLVDSLSHPGGNATGVVNIAALLDGKRVELLRDLAPKATSLAFLVNPHNPSRESETNVVAAASALRQDYYLLFAGSETDLDAAFASMRERPGSMLLVQSDPFLLGEARRIVDLAAQYKIPASYPFRDVVSAGGLMSYGADIGEQARQAAIYVGRILKGAKPAELPVVQPTKFQFVINLKAARALGLTIPPALLARADEVIE